MRSVITISITVVFHLKGHLGTGQLHDPAFMIETTSPASGAKFAHERLYPLWCGIIRIGIEFLPVKRQKPVSARAGTDKQPVDGIRLMPLNAQTPYKNRGLSAAGGVQPTVGYPLIWQYLQSSRTVGIWSR